MPKYANKRQRNHVRADERGFILIITMLILVVLTIVGMAALDSSIFEVKIASNDRWAKVAFNLADGSVYSTSKLLSEAIAGGADPSHAPVSFVGFQVKKDDDTIVTVPHVVGDFYSRAMGYKETMTTVYNADNTQPEPLPDFMIVPEAISPKENVTVTLVARQATMMAGGGAEFGAGAAGAGVGAGGAGAAVTFDVDVSGFAGNNTKSTVSARYRKVLGTSGGL